MEKILFLVAHTPWVRKKPNPYPRGCMIFMVMPWNGSAIITVPAIMLKAQNTIRKAPTVVQNASYLAVVGIAHGENHPPADYRGISIGFRVDYTDLPKS